MKLNFGKVCILVDNEHRLNSFSKSYVCALEALTVD